MKRRVVTLACMLLGSTGLGHPATAVALVDTVGFGGTLPSFTVGGETFTETACTSTLCNGLKMLQDGSNIGIVVSSATNGGSIISASTAGADLTLTFSVSGSQQINAVGLGVTGSNGGNTANNAAIGFGETITSSPSATGGVTLASATQWVSLPGGFSSLDLGKDIFVHGFAMAPGTTGSVTSVIQDLQFVPEPASAAILVAGLAAAVGARRARRRA